MSAALSKRKDRNPEGTLMEGIRFERRGHEAYYPVLLHVGSMYVPLTAEDVTALQKNSTILGETFLEYFLDRVGSSSYLKDHIRTALVTHGNTTGQISFLRQAIQNL